MIFLSASKKKVKQKLNVKIEKDGNAKLNNLLNPSAKSEEKKVN